MKLLVPFLGLVVMLSSCSVFNQDDGPCNESKYFKYKIKYRSRYDTTKADLTISFIDDEDAPLFTPNLVVKVFPFYPNDRKDSRFAKPKELGLQRKIFTQKTQISTYEFDLSNSIGKKP